MGKILRSMQGKVTGRSTCHVSLRRRSTLLRQPFVCYDHKPFECINKSVPHAPHVTLDARGPLMLKTKYELIGSLCTLGLHKH